MPDSSKLCLLFDLDGTLTDSDHLHLQAFNRILSESGRSVGKPDYTRHVMGADNGAIARYLFPEVTREEGTALLDRKEAMFREMLSGLQPMPGLGALLEWAQKHALPCAIVTNAPRANAEMMIAALGLTRRIPTLVIGSELTHSKPHPLPYLTGLQRLGGRADKALAFEDSRSGLRAAVDAGIATVGLTTSLTAAEIRETGAALAVADYTDARLWETIAAMSGLTRP